MIATSIKHTIKGSPGTLYELVHNWNLTEHELSIGLPIVNVSTLPDWDERTGLVVSAKSPNAILLRSSGPFEGAQFEVEVFRSFWQPGKEIRTDEPKTV